MKLGLQITAEKTVYIKTARYPGNEEDFNELMNYKYVRVERFTYLEAFVTEQKDKKDRSRQ